MKFTPTILEGVIICDQDRRSDERGFFARTFCRDEFSEHGLAPVFVQCNTSYNQKMGTLRGLHLQEPPHEEAKLVRCTRGAIFDVVVDVRPQSADYCRWIAVELTADNGRMVYIPGGFAHGFQTLADSTEVFYQMSAMYEPTAARGFLWKDKAFGIAWPLDNPTLSPKDATYEPVR